MKTVEIQLYKFEELSEAAQQKAVQNWNSTNDYSFSNDEIIDSLNGFADAFNVTIKDYSIGYRSDISARFNQDDEVLALSGARLYTYLNNNYSNILFERKGYGKFEKKPNGKFDYKRRSRITFTQTCCPFTGVCFDEDILQPIRDFMQKPGKHYTFESLLSDCISAAEKTAENAAEYESSFEYIKDAIIANEYDFTEDGEIY